MPLDRDLVIFDLETSGKDPDTCSILQIGAVRFKRDGMISGIKAPFSKHVKPYTDVWEDEAEGVHGMTKTMAENWGFPIMWALSEFQAWCGDVRGFYLATWSSGWDIAVLRNAYKHVQVEYPFYRRSYDIASFTRIYLAKIGKLGKKHQSLSGCARKIGFDTSKLRLHNALVDAELTAKILERIWNEL